jgi:rSAM/selenodomain-associated transferase 2
MQNVSPVQARLPDCGFAGNVAHMSCDIGRLTIVIPVLDEAAIIAAALQALAPLRARGAEVIVVDGGSSDGTAALARRFADRVIAGPHNRGAALNAGAALGRGDVFIFLHADTTLPDCADRLIAAALSRRTPDRCWGRFDLRIAGRHPLLALVARMINWRSRLTGIATGDQAIFVTRNAFWSVGGFPDLPLMEDIALSRKLMRLCRPLCIAAPAVTSGRRWDYHGLWHTIVLMWRLRLAYYLGAEPARLALAYGRIPPSPAQSSARP